MFTLNPSHIDVDVVVNGCSLSKIRHQDRCYVVADKGAKWVLRIRNRTCKRILVVSTVDGLSVVDGKEGSYASDGYILNRLGIIDIPGFRLNDNEVAAFRFGGKNESYAARMGKPTNVGVIGVAAFEEIPPPPIVDYDHLYRDYGMEMYSSGKIPVFIQEAKTSGCYYLQNCITSSVQNVGTAFAEKETHKVVRTVFDRQPTPVEIVDIFYDDYDGLASKGVLVLDIPQSFPGTGCTPPPGWKKA